MAIRRWLVQPDREMLLPEGGVLGVVSREAFVDGVIDAVALVDRAGGGFTVFASRHPTGVEHEMVTTGVMVEWRDRTDAKPQPERPEQPAPDKLGGQPPSEPDDEPVLEPDGLDPATLEEEDVSEVPEAVR